MGYNLRQFPREVSAEELEESALIGIVVVNAVAPKAAQAAGTPANNRAGMFLLKKIIADGLEGDGISPSCLCAIGELNRCAVSVLVPWRDKARTIETVKTVLEECLLLELSWIGYFDHRELIWRGIFPGPHIHFEQMWKDIQQLGELLAEKRKAEQ